MTVIRVLDFETSDLPPHAAVLEVGYTDINLYDNGLATLHDPVNFIVDPQRPIALGALATHHITEARIKREAETSAKIALAHLARAPVDIWVAHVMAFERQFFNPPGSRWICTHKVSRALWPTAPKHTNQMLRYFLGVAVDDPRGDPPHRAGPDTWVTAHIFLTALKRMSLREMIDISGGDDKPRLLETCEFGTRYKGRSWASIPNDFLTWVTQNTRDSDVRHTAQYWLDKRRG